MTNDQTKPNALSTNLLLHVRLAALTGLCTGLAEAMWWGRGIPAAERLASALLGAGSIATLGAALGLVCGLGAAVWNASRAESAIQDDPEVRRDALARTLALVATSVLAGILALGVLAKVLVLVGRVAEPGLRIKLTLVAAGGLAVVAGVATAVAHRWVVRPFQKFAKRYGLPWPRTRLARTALWLVLPTVTLNALVLWRYGGLLGLGDIVLCLPLFVVSQVLIHQLVTGLQRSARRERAGWLAVAGCMGWAMVSPPAPGVEASPIAGTAVRALRALTDVDRDHFSSLYGGRDCATWNAAIHPAARDIAGDGIDQNCNGSDQKRGALSVVPQPTWFGDSSSIGAPRRPYNVVWFILEATRSDHCQFNGYAKPTTPYLGRLADEAMVFSQAYSQAPLTMLSIPSMLTGRDPMHIQWTTGSKKVHHDQRETTLAEYLRTQRGYATMMVTQSWMQSEMPAVHDGFDTVESYWLDGQQEPWERDSAAIAVPVAIKLVGAHMARQQAKPSPFLLTVYMPAPHHPYDIHSEGYPDFGPGDLGAYDNEIAFADRYIGMLLEYLKYGARVWDDTIVVVTADHGESFGEHNKKYHSWNCHRESVHVPLIVRVPGLAARKVSTPVALVDIVPTLIELTGGEATSLSLDGQSLLVPAFGAADSSEERAVTCTTAPLARLMSYTFYWQGLRTADRFFTRNVLSGEVALYDTTKDRGEVRNVANDGRERSTLERMAEGLETAVSGNLWEARVKD